VSTWRFVEDIDVGDVEHGSGYPSGIVVHVLCQTAAVVF